MEKGGITYMLSNKNNSVIFDDYRAIAYFATLLIHGDQLVCILYDENWHLNRACSGTAPSHASHARSGHRPASSGQTTSQK